MFTKEKKISIFRERFYGRQDVYGSAWETVNKHGEKVKGYRPACSNFWTSVCYIKNKDGKKTCATCEHKSYSPITDETTWQHIIGADTQCTYLLLNDGTVRFAAFDLDCKPHAPEKGYTYEDVRALSKLMAEHDIPHHIARSTTSGFHMYLFFSEAFSAAKWRGIADWLLEEVGFFEQTRLGLRPLPEVFPKQAYVSGFGIGNSIKPPMIEANWPKERNGFVDRENNFIPVDKQWEYLESAEHCKVEHLDALIAKHGIEVREETPAEVRKGSRSDFGTIRKRDGSYQAPLTGSIEKIVEGCAALNKLMEKCKKGEVLTHHEGFALWHIAIHVKDGVEYFEKNVPEWGKTHSDAKQLQYSIDKGYSPYTCKKLQELGVCAVGRKCFDRKPPQELVEGRLVDRDDIPENKWPEPSPIRYGYGRGDDFLAKLKKEVDEVTPDLDENTKGNKLRELAKRAQVFDEDQQRDFKKYIQSKKIMRSPDLSKMFNRASDEHSKETKKRIGTRDDSVEVGDTVYRLRQPFGYLILKRVRQDAEFVTLTNFSIDVEEIRSYLEEDDVQTTEYVGVFRSESLVRSFMINVNEWVDNTKFMSKFQEIASPVFNVLRNDVEHLKQAALAFSEKAGLTKTNKLITQGWYQETFLMPGIQIDRDGISPNTEKEIDLTGKGHSCLLEFKTLDDTTFREVLLHVKNDFLNTWPRINTTCGIAQALLPPLIKPLGISTKPTLFYEGLTGSGKTALCQLLQHFWGDFPSLVNLSSTAKSIEVITHDFKDCLLVLDDYKELDNRQRDALKRTIQSSYDPFSTFKLNADSSLKPPKQPRGVLICTGETFLSNDAAVVARTILIEVNKLDTMGTMDRFSVCWAKKSLYCGITPRFIHWFLQKDLKEVRKELGELKVKFLERTHGAQNADRIAHNMSLNHLCWKLFVSFMVDHGVCSKDEMLALIAEHWDYALWVQFQMIGRCGEEQNAKVFLEVLIQLIAANSLVIDGLNLDDTTKGKQCVGYLETNEVTGQKVVNIFSDLSLKVVKDIMKYNELRGNIREFGRQFHDMNLLAERSHDRYQVQRRYNGARVYVWSFHADKISINDGVPVPLPSQNSKQPLSIPESSYQVPASEGHF